MSAKITGAAELSAALSKLSKATFQDVATKSIGEMYSRAKKGYTGGQVPAGGGSPVSTELTRPHGPHGELKSSLRFEKDTMGYTKEYAPHVEYGHRTKSGGFVPGQHFLKSNVDIQAPKYKKDLIDAIRKIAKG